MSVEFHQLKVADVRPETDDSVSITLEVPEDLTDRFVHVPGQHLVIRRDLGGEDVRRSYSICSAPGDGLRVGIKRIPDGVFSTWATTELAPGEVLEVMAPIGEFVTECRADRARRVVLVAAGSGITPILAMATTILRDEPASTVTLLYGNRTSQTIMFHEELEGLKNRHPERFRMIHVLSREPHEVPLFQGRIDGPKLEQLAGSLLDVDAVDGWYLCGPMAMVEDLSATLATLGVPDDRINAELFFDERIEAPPAGDGSAEADENLVETRVTIEGRTSVVYVDPEGPSILDYARSVRAEVPFACKGGMCATCKGRLIEGEVTMTKNFALTDGEVADGLILTCQAHPSGDGPLAISYDVYGSVGR